MEKWERTYTEISKKCRNKCGEANRGKKLKVKLYVNKKNCKMNE